MPRPSREIPKGRAFTLAMLLILGLFTAPASAQQVVDLSGPDGPALAYGRFASATAAWRSGLEGPRDAWGNLRSEGYVSASRPDALAAALLDFLRDWFAERPELGLRIARSPLEAQTLRCALAAERALAAARVAAADAAKLAEKQGSARAESAELEGKAAETGTVEGKKTPEPAIAPEAAGAGEDVPSLGTSDTKVGEEEPGNDGFPADFAGVRWLHTDVSSWEETARLSVKVGGSQIDLDYDKASTWPTGQDVGLELVANPWIFVKRDGVWYAATWEWLRPGQCSKSRRAVAGDHIKQSPLQDFQPRSGERYGFMVSGLARGGTRNVMERSNLVWVTWP